MSLQHYASREDWTRAMTPERVAKQFAAERSYARSFAAEGAIPGFCRTCGAVARFSFEPARSEDPPNWRESLHCNGCGLFSRIRFSLDVLMQRRPLAGARIYITEQTTPVYVWLKRSGAQVRGSEYVTDPARRAALDAYVASITGGLDTALEVEDVTRLSFADASQDVVMSFDVLEHVPDFRAALREFRRVLAAGGTLVVSVPFDWNSDRTLTRARLGPDGSIEHLVAPEYHGDPTTSEGCLAFYTYGWELLDEMRRAGFEDVHLESQWSPAFGYLGAQLTIVARAGAAA